MKFASTLIGGCTMVDLQPVSDPLGLAARCYDEDEFRRYGLPTAWPQQDIVANRHAHTLRGLYMTPGKPQESLLIRCIQGSVFLVVVDLRPEASTFQLWLGLKLTVKSGRALFVPPGCAYGMMSLVEDSTVIIDRSARARPDAAKVFRWNDPAFGIDWPAVPKHIAHTDATAPNFVPSAVQRQGGTAA